MRLFLGLVQRCGLSRYSTHSIITLSRIVIGILLNFHLIFSWFLGKTKKLNCISRGVEELELKLYVYC